MIRNIFALLVVAVVSMLVVPVAVLAGPPDPGVVSKFQPGKTWQGEQVIEDPTGYEMGRQNVTFAVDKDGKVSVKMSGAELRTPARVSGGKSRVPPVGVENAEGNFGIDGDNRPVVTVSDGKRELAFRLDDGRVILDDYAVGRAKHNKAFLK